MGNQQRMYYEGKEYRTVPFAPRYKVSEYGDIYSTISKKHLSFTYTRGYKRVGVATEPKHKSHYLVHRIVALTFIDNPHNLPEVNHIDGNKLNNHISNLEWVTREQNIQHAYDTGLNSVEGEKNGNHILSEKEVVDIYNDALSGVSKASLARKYGVSKSCIQDVVTKRNWAYLLEDLPPIGVSKYSNKLSEDTVHDICRMLQEGRTNKEIFDFVGKDTLSKYRLHDIKRRKCFAHISKDYKW